VACSDLDKISRASSTEDGDAWVLDLFEIGTLTPKPQERRNHSFRDWHLALRLLSRTESLIYRLIWRSIMRRRIRSLFRVVVTSENQDVDYTSGGNMSQNSKRNTKRISGGSSSIYSLRLPVYWELLAWLHVDLAIVNRKPSQHTPNLRRLTRKRTIESIVLFHTAVKSATLDLNQNRQLEMSFLKIAPTWRMVQLDDILCTRVIQEDLKNRWSHCQTNRHNRSIKVLSTDKNEVEANRRLEG